MGDDAALFAGASDNTATVEEDDDNDLLGGGGDGYQNGGANGGGEMLDFESSFPAVDTSNNVRTRPSPAQFLSKEIQCSRKRSVLTVAGNGSRRDDHGVNIAIPERCWTTPAELRFIRYV